jgi:hypothetical protein
MKKIFSFILTAALFCAVKVSAQSIVVPEVFTISGTAQIQQDSYISGANIIAPAPSKSSITTKSLLANLAAAEFNAGNYVNSTFPAGSYVVYWNDLRGPDYSWFAVADSQGNYLCDVSDVLTWTQLASAVENYSYNTNTGLYASDKQTYMGLLSYDDTGAGGYQNFQLTGLCTVTRADTANAKTRLVKIKISAALNLSGAGEVSGYSATASGTASASGVYYLSY